MERNPSGKSVTELVADLAHQASTLVRDEVRLAKAEISEKVDQATGGAVSLIVGALIALAGLIMLLDAVVLLLTGIIRPDQPWVAPLIVGIAVPIIGLLVMMRGRRRLSSEEMAPRRTMHSLNRDREVFRG